MTWRRLFIHKRQKTAKHNNCSFARMSCFPFSSWFLQKRSNEAAVVNYHPGYQCKCQLHSFNGSISLRIMLQHRTPCTTKWSLVLNTCMKVQFPERAYCRDACTPSLHIRIIIRDHMLLNWINKKLNIHSPWSCNAHIIDVYAWVPPVLLLC